MPCRATERAWHSFPISIGTLFSDVANREADNVHLHHRTHTSGLLIVLSLTCPVVFVLGSREALPIR